MARHGNSRHGKKMRDYGGSKTKGMSKHRQSGPSAKNNPFQRMVDNTQANKAAEARKVTEQRRRPQMHLTVAEAMKDRK